MYRYAREFVDVIVGKGMPEIAQNVIAKRDWWMVVQCTKKTGGGVAVIVVQSMMLNANAENTDGNEWYY